MVKPSRLTSIYERKYLFSLLQVALSMLDTERNHRVTQRETIESHREKPSSHTERNHRVTQRETIASQREKPSSHTERNHRVTQRETIESHREKPSSHTERNHRVTQRETRLHCNRQVAPQIEHMLFPLGADCRQYIYPHFSPIFIEFDQGKVFLRDF